MTGVEILTEDGRRHVDQFGRRPDAVDRRPVLRHPLGTHRVQCRQEEVDHRSEVVEDQTLVEARPLGDRPRARPAKPSALRVSTAASTSCLRVPAERDESDSLAATLLDVPDLAMWPPG